MDPYTRFCHWTSSLAVPQVELVGFHRCDVLRLSEYDGYNALRARVHAPRQERLSLEAPNGSRYIQSGRI